MDEQDYSIGRLLDMYGLNNQQQQPAPYGMSMWGYPKTAYNDAPYYLPREMVGDWMYRNQGNVLHGGLAALSMMTPMGAGARAATMVPNLAYLAYANALGRTAPGYAENANALANYKPPQSLPGDAEGKQISDWIHAVDVAKAGRLPMLYPNVKWSDADMKDDERGRWRRRMKTALGGRDGGY